MKRSVTAANKVDFINVVLIIVSLLLSFLLPFSLFLFSYAVLGPLHYMTEINWLNEKNYFIKNRRWIWFFISLSLLVSIPVIFNLSVFSLHSQPEVIRNLILGIAAQTDLILLTMILFAVGVVFLKKWTHVVLFLVLSLFLSKLITRYVLGSYILVGIFLPTIIHVYLFTFFFMLLGALNSNSRVGWIGLLLLGLCPVIIMFSEINPALYTITESGKSISTAQNFRFTNYIAGYFNASANERIISLSATGIKIQTFVAFCYTYHYLNWFSKVSD